MVFSGKKMEGLKLDKTIILKPEYLTSKHLYFGYFVIFK